MYVLCVCVCVCLSANMPPPPSVRTKCTQMCTQNTQYAPGVQLVSGTLPPLPPHQERAKSGSPTPPDLLPYRYPPKSFFHTLDAPKGAVEYYMNIYIYIYIHA